MIYSRVYRLHNLRFSLKGFFEQNFEKITLQNFVRKIFVSSNSEKKLEYLIIFALLGAAALHAWWNFILKGSGDKSVAIMSIYFTSLPFAVIGMALTGIPDFSTLPLLILSALLQTGYCIALFKAYQIGQLSTIYPLARGSAPIFVFVIAFVIFDTNYSLQAIYGIAVICIGLLSYGVVVILQSNLKKDVTLAALTVGFFIALYSITDAYAIKVIGNALSFLGGMAIMNRIFLLSYLYYSEKSFITRLTSEFEYKYVVGGFISFICYVTVLWAYLHLPVAVVSSVRETSIIFAVLLGIFFLKEKIDFIKGFMITMVFIGLSIFLGQ